MARLVDFEDTNGDEIVLYRNDVRTLEITIRDAADAAQDISSWNSFKFGIKKNITDSSFIVNGTGTILDTGVGGTNQGRVDVIIPLTGSTVGDQFSASDLLITAFIEFTAVDGSTQDVTLQQSPVTICRDINV